MKRAFLPILLFLKLSLFGQSSFASELVIRTPAPVGGEYQQLVVPSEEGSLAAEPKTVDFGAVRIGSSKTLPVKIVNNNTKPVSIADFVVNSSKNEFYVEGTNCPDVIQAGSSCEVLVTARPLSIGTKSSQLASELADGGFIQLGALRVTGGLANPLLTSNSIDFGTVTPGSSISKVLNLTNAGNVELTISKIQTFDTDVKVDSNCGTTILPGENCVLNVSFNPKPSRPSLSSPLHIYYTGANKTYSSVQLTARIPNLYFKYNGVAVNKLNLGSSPAGVPSGKFEVLLVNPSGFSYNILPGQITAPAPFMVDDSDCIGFLVGSSECKLVIEANSTSVRKFVTGLTPTIENLEVPPTLELIFEATSSGLLISSTALDFGSVNVGSRKDLSVEIFNITPDGKPINLTFGGSDYSVTTNCGFSLPANSSCIANVTFAPSVIGARSGFIEVKSGDTTSTISLSGLGQSAIPVAIPSSLNFGVIAVNSSKSLDLKIQNDGNLPFTVKSLTFSNEAFSLVANFCTQTLQPNQSCKLTVSAYAESAGVITGTLSIVSDSTNLNVPLTVEAKNTELKLYSIDGSPANGVFADVFDTGNIQPKGFILENTSPFPVDVNKISLSATTVFSITNDQCSGVTLAPRKQCGFYISAGNVQSDVAYNSTLTVFSNAVVNPSPLSVSLIVKPAFALKDFVWPTFDTSSASKTFDLRQLLEINDNSISLNSINLTVKDLPPGLNVTNKIVRGQPSIGGSYRVTVEAEYAGRVVRRDYLVAVSTNRLYTLNPTLLDFSEVELGSSKTLQVLITSAVNYSLNIQPAITNSSQYRIVRNTCANLQPLGSCIVDVEFKPTTLGAHNALITIYQNDNLQATGFGALSDWVSPREIDVGTFEAGQDSATATIQIRNGSSKSTTLKLYKNPEISVFQSSSNSCSYPEIVLQSGQTCNLDFRVTGYINEGDYLSTVYIDTLDGTRSFPVSVKGRVAKSSQVSINLYPNNDTRYLTANVYKNSIYAIISVDGNIMLTRIDKDGTQRWARLLGGRFGVYPDLADSNSDSSFFIGGDRIWVLTYPASNIGGILTSFDLNGNPLYSAVTTDNGNVSRLLGVDRFGNAFVEFPSGHLGLLSPSGEIIKVSSHLFSHLPTARMYHGRDGFYYRTEYIHSTSSNPDMPVGILLQRLDSNFVPIKGLHITPNRSVPAYDFTHYAEVQQDEEGTLYLNNYAQAFAFFIISPDLAYATLSEPYGVGFTRVPKTSGFSSSIYERSDGTIGFRGSAFSITISSANSSALSVFTSSELSVANEAGDTLSDTEATFHILPYTAKSVIDGITEKNKLAIIITPPVATNKEFSISNPATDLFSKKDFVKVRTVRNVGLLYKKNIVATTTLINKQPEISVLPSVHSRMQPGSLPPSAPLMTSTNVMSVSNSDYKLLPWEFIQLSPDTRISLGSRKLYDGAIVSEPYVLTNTTKDVWNLEYSMSTSGGFTYRVPPGASVYIKPFLNLPLSALGPQSFDYTFVAKSETGVPIKLYYKRFKFELTGLPSNHSIETLYVPPTESTAVPQSPKYFERVYSGSTGVGISDFINGRQAFSMINRDGRLVYPVMALPKSNDPQISILSSRDAHSLYAAPKLNELAVIDFVSRSYTKWGISEGNYGIQLRYLQSGANSAYIIATSSLSQVTRKGQPNLLIKVNKNMELQYVARMGAEAIQVFVPVGEDAGGNYYLLGVSGTYTLLYKISPQGQLMFVRDVSVASTQKAEIVGDKIIFMGATAITYFSLEGELLSSYNINESLTNKQVLWQDSNRFFAYGSYANLGHHVFMDCNVQAFSCKFYRGPFTVPLKAYGGGALLGVSGSRFVFAMGYDRVVYDSAEPSSADFTYYHVSSNNAQFVPVRTPVQASEINAAEYFVYTIYQPTRHSWLNALSPKFLIQTENQQAISAAVAQYKLDTAKFSVGTPVSTSLEILPSGRKYLSIEGGPRTSIVGR